MFKEVLKKLWEDKFARISLIILGVIYFSLFFADFIAPYTKDFSDRTMAYVPPSKIFTIDENGKFSKPYTYNYKREFDAQVTVGDVAASIGAGLARAALAGKVNGKLVDLSTPITENSTVAIITDKDPEGLEIIRHSTSHLMAQAVKEDIHYLLYALSHSAAMNGVNETTHTVNVMTWWRILYIVCIAVFGLATVFCGVCYAVGRRKSTDQKTEKGA